MAVAVRTDLPQSLLWCTLYCSDAAGAEGRAAAAAHLDAFLRGGLDTAVLEAAQRGTSTAAAAAGSRASGSQAEVEAAAEAEEANGVDAALDDYLQPPAMRRHWQPLLTFVTVPELPRGWEHGARGECKPALACGQRVECSWL